MEFRSLDPPPPAGNEPPASDAGSPDGAALTIPEDQERDVWWGAYAGRALLPSFLLCILLTLILTGVAVFLGVSEGRPSLPIRYAAYALTGIIWCFQLFRGGYRMVVWTYRLTTRRLFQEWSFWSAPYRAVELRHITRVVVERTAWERWLDVGRLRIVTPNGTWSLEGIGQPEHVAGTIQIWIDRVRAPCTR
jgi:hypothetical protein